MRQFSIVFLVIIFVACSSSPVPKDILPPKEMQQVLSDLIRIDEFLNGFVIKDSTVDVKKKRSMLYEQAFRIRNTNRKQFYSSYQYYQRHPDIQKEVFDSLFESLTRTKVEVGRKKPGEGAK